MTKTLLTIGVLLLVLAAILQLHSTSPAPRAPQLVNVYLAEYTTPPATSLVASMSGVRPLVVSPPKEVRYQGKTVLYVIVHDGNRDYLRVEGRQMSGIVNGEDNRQLIRAEAITDNEQKKELATLLAANAPGHDVRFQLPE